MNFYAKARVLTVAVLFKVLFGTGPILKLLQLSAGTLQVLEFSKYYGIGHESTPACDKIAGVEGIDTSLAVITSIMMWYSLAPLLFMMASILVPTGAKFYFPSEMTEEMEMPNLADVKDKEDKGSEEGVKGVKTPDLKYAKDSCISL